MLRRLIAGVVLVGLVGSGLVVAWVWKSLDEPLVVGDTGYDLIVAKGEGASSVLRTLETDGVIRWSAPARLYLRWAGRQVHAGEYTLGATDSVRSLLDKMEQGLVNRYQITFPEGWTLRQWLDLLARQERIDCQVVGKSPADIAAALGIDAINPEGWFAPDTYVFVTGDSDLDILRRAHVRMQEVVADLWPKRGPDLPYASPYEALILASIIERETGVPAERADIAGVFVRRLAKKMPLQTDPTVIYGLGETYAGNLTRQHLGTPSPYNTYLVSGLPPTPIANPGVDALRAALNPAAGNALYFVATGDGSHQFSTTLDEHRKAVRKYQFRPRANYRSAPDQK